MSTVTYPWGTGRAPAHHCHGCQRAIGLRAGHFVFDGNLLLCGRCTESWRGSSRAAHAKQYPDCPTDWHDMWDHFACSGTRAGIWYVLTGRVKRCRT